MESKKDSIEQFFGVDLHVHTPASSCYKGSKDEHEYMNILRMYSDKQIKVIAITDHNTIKGYEKILSIKSNLISKSNILHEYVKSHPELEKELELLRQDISLFDNILILPGIEFEAVPGIHLLLIFSPKSDLQQINQFLIESGYSMELQGKEKIDTITHLDVIQAMKIATSLGAIVIAPHVDSDKGLYNVLEGTYRAQVMRSSDLVAISYNNSITAEKIRSLFHNKEYKREQPVALIQCSDYHGEKGTMAPITYLMLNSISFEEVCAALLAPNERVSPTEHPERISILKKIIDDPTSVLIEDMVDNNYIKQVTCSILNNGYGTMLIGIASKPSINIVGIKGNAENCQELIRENLEHIKPAMYKISINIFPYGFERFVLAVTISSVGKNIYFAEDENKSYILKDGVVVVAEPTDIEEITERRILNRIEEYSELTRSKYDKVLNEIESLKNSAHQFSIIYNIERLSVKLANIVTLETVKPYGDYRMPFEFINGDSDGNVMVVDRCGPRYPYAYLRYSCPKTKKIKISELNNIKLYTQSAIIIVDGGASYFIDSDKEWAILNTEARLPALVLKLKNSLDNLISPKTLIGWLKSSLHIWYCHAALGSINMHNPNIYNNIHVPLNKISKHKEEIDKLVENIIIEENAFLTTLLESDEKDDDSVELVNRLLDEHNGKIEKLAKNIDDILYKEFGIDSEMEIIKKLFKAKDLFIPN